MFINDNLLFCAFDTNNINISLDGAEKCICPKPCRDGEEKERKKMCLKSEAKRREEEEKKRKKEEEWKTVFLRW